MTYLLLAIALLAEQDRVITPIGEFSNVYYTAEHEYGYTVQLWQDGETVIGMFFYSGGLQGDAPRGVLENVEYNPRTGQLSFRAKLSIGMTNGNQWSKDLFEFSGQLSQKNVAGALRGPFATEHVDLKKRQPPGFMSPTRSYLEWKHQADEVLKLLRPKW